MNVACVITMFDEHAIVLQSIKNIKSVFVNSYISVSHSDDKQENESLREIKNIVNDYTLFDDLSKIYSRYEYPSYSICRNLSNGFNKVYQNSSNIDLIVAFTGDTSIFDANNFMRRSEEMKINNWKAMVSQAIGQDFHSKTANPNIGIFGGRFQNQDTTDFACCLFFVDGNFGLSTKAFSNIVVCNSFTSEECLGNNLSSKLNFKLEVGRLNKNATYCYDYSDGVIYHAKNGKPSR